jgi:hypothetical protein
MKYYRLSESHPRYGLVGNVIPELEWKKLPYTERPLYDAVEEGGSGFAYKVEMSYADKSPSLFYLDSYPDIIIMASRIRSRGKNSLNGATYDPTATIQPKMDQTWTCEGYTMKITYRKEWELN